MSSGTSNQNSKSMGGFWGAVAIMVLFGGAFTFFGVMALLVGFKGNARQPEHDAWVRWPLGGLLFTAIGLAFDFGIFAACFKMNGRDRHDQRQYPDQPWMLNKQWAAGKIADDSGSSAVAAWIFAGLWNAISLPLFILAQWKGDAGKFIWLVALFPIVGCGLFIAAIYLTARRMKFGKCSFEMEKVPGCIGGWIAGTLYTSKIIDATDGIRLELKCVNRVTTGSGKNSSTSEFVLWQDRQTLSGRLPRQGLGLALPISFAIPGECSATRDGGNNSIVWRLTASAAEPGIDFKATFTVPVFEVAGASVTTPPQEAHAAKLRAPEPPAEQRALEAHLGFKKDAAGREFFEFPWTRNLKQAISLTVFGLIFCGIGVGITVADGPGLFTVAFGGVGLILLLVAILWLKGRSIAVRQDDVELRWSLFGLGGGQSVPRAKIMRVDYASSSQVNNVAYYKVRFATDDGKSIVAAAGAHRLTTRSLSRRS